MKRVGLSRNRDSLILDDTTEEGTNDGEEGATTGESSGGAGEHKEAADNPKVNNEAS